MTTSVNTAGSGYALTPAPPGTKAGPPALTDDSSKGYFYGSIMVDTVASNIYFCVNPAVGAADWVLLAHSLSLASGHAGDGSDGALDFDGTKTYTSVCSTTGVAPNLAYTLIRDAYATTVDIRAGISVRGAGFWLYHQGLFKNRSGTTTNAGFHNNGTSATSETAPVTVSAEGTIAAVRTGGGNGANVGAGAAANGSNGGGSGGRNCAGSASGAGGAAGASTGGTANSSAFPTAVQGTLHSAGYAGNRRLVDNSTANTGGGGGGGAGRSAAAGTAKGGGGGQGGGALAVVGTIYDGGTTGLISADGGDGYIGVVTGDGIAGGGGGGAAGWAWCWWSYVLAEGTLRANGGSGGAGAGGGLAGSDGTVGTVYRLYGQVAV